MKIILKKIKNIFISGVIAFIALTLFCLVYYNIPIHVYNTNGSTDYIWERDKYYISMTEGIGFGKTNNEGLMNIDDYKDNLQVDVLVMGSSHLQGFPIAINDNCSNILNNLLEDRNVYNIAITGHNIKTCISNLDAALSKYKPNVVVIETNNINLNENEINNIINNKIENISSISNPIVNILQKNPFLRQSYSQIESLANKQANEDIVSTNNKKEFDKYKTNELLKYISLIVNKYETKVILMYHPTVCLNEDGTLKVNNDTDALNMFNSLCSDNNIYFLDMSNRYLEEYNKDFTLPTGFINTAVASGHINKNGHRMMAEELYKIIKEIDK